MWFRKAHSTYMALLKLMEDISNELDNKNHSIGIFIDLSKAFDTIDHILLCKKKNTMAFVELPSIGSLVI